MVRLEEAEDPVEYHERTTGENLLKKYDIPLHHLDFAYVEQCKDGRELEKIYHVLKSGQEGYYPDLLRATESRMAQIKPNSKYLRKLTPVLSKDDLDEDELKKITDDFDEWLRTVNRNNRELTEAHRGFPQQRDIPEVRKTAAPGQKGKPPEANKRIASTDYASWDKFDAETEMLKMDLEDEKLRKLASVEGQRKKPSATVKFGGFPTNAQASFEANREKEKGNECFKAGEYEDALAHYTNSIALCPNAILYTNRAITCLRMKKYEKAIADCQSALKHDARNLKANLRMAQALRALNQPDDALVYAENAIRIDPNNSLAQQIARETRGQNPKARNVRFKIVETAREPPKPILKKAELIPIAGSSRMQPPYFEVAGRQKPTNRLLRALLPVSVALEEANDDDDECECLEQHVQRAKGNSSDFDENRISKGKNYVVVDNRHAPSIKRKESHGGGFNGNGKSKAGKNFRAKGSSKKTDCLIKQVEENNEAETKAIVNREPQIIEDDDSRRVSDAQNREDTTTPRHCRVTVEDNTAEDVRGGGGEPHVPQRQSSPVIPREIHLPYTFVKTWQSVKRDGSYSGFASIIRSLNMQRITEVIGNKIDATILSDIINCLYRHFTVADEVQMVYETLSNLCRLQRFRIAVMFLSQGDKRLVQNLMDFLGQHGRALPEDVRAHYALESQK